MKVIALLPMKAHSERVPNKNFRIFGDKPLYHHILQVLESSELVEHVLINTDSDCITNDVKKKFSKVTIINRPLELRGDFVPMNKIIEHDIKLVKDEHFLQTHSTNPLLSKNTLEKAIVQYFEIMPNHDSLFSVTKIQNRFFWESGLPVNHNPKKLDRTQDLSPLFEENSSIYLFSRTSFTTSNNNRIGLKPKMFNMKKLEAMDIDDEEDWKIAEALYKLKIKV